MEKSFEIKGDEFIAKSSKNYISLKIGCLKFLDSYRILITELNGLSQTITSIPTLDANGVKGEFFFKKNGSAI